MQGIAINQTVIGLTLAGLLLFGILYALLTRWLSRRNVRGQTALMVAGGVTVNLVAMIPLLGLETVALLFAGFAASGLPMIVEYAIRVEAESQEQRDALKKITLDSLESNDR